MEYKTRMGATMGAQNWERNVVTTPTGHARTLRRVPKRCASSFKPGKMHPVMFVPLLREDALRTTRVRVACDMAETSDLLMNAVRFIVHAYFVPKLALSRFGGMDDLNRSYNVVSGAPAWFDTAVGANPAADTILHAAGVHPVVGDNVNLDYIQSFNAVWNFRAKNRSSSLTLRGENDTDIPAAFWPATVFKHVKPTFDQALIEGEVPLNVVGSELVIKTNTANDSASTVSTDAASEMFMASTANQDPANKMFAELADDGITVSLSNIDMARKTAAWARLRQQYQGLDEDWMMDQLLSGIGIPEQYLQHPMLLDRKETVFGMNQRYATDSGNLDKSATLGMTYVDLTLRVPQMNTGGCVVVVAEVVPEQIFERILDPYLHATAPSDLPERTRDELDPEPVDVVLNKRVDVDHASPTDVFGYEPLNAEWQTDIPLLGGKFWRNAGDAWSEDRNRIWTPEVDNPVLGSNFYLAEDLEYEVFADAASDPFEINAQGMFQIDGLTYFGPALRESTGDYDAVLAKVDQTRIDQGA